MDSTTTQVRSTFRRWLIAGGLVAGGALAGPMLVAATGDSGGGVGDHPELVGSGAPSVFVPINTYRNLDTRLDKPDKLRASEDGGFGLNPIVTQVQFDRTNTEELAIPDTAVAVSYNVTVTDTEGAGFVQVDTTSATWGATSTVNWSGAGETVANSGVVLLGSAFDSSLHFAGIYLGGTPDAAAHIVFDITGYYIVAT